MAVGWGAATTGWEDCAWFEGVAREEFEGEGDGFEEEVEEVWEEGEDEYCEEDYAVS